MSMRTNSLLSLLLLAAPGTALAGEAAHWDYSGEHDPAHWASLQEDYATCGLGKHQSPINIDATHKERLPAIQFKYHAGPLAILNNGHTVQVNVAEGNGIQVGEDRYKLLQFHVHTPSEEQVHGKPYDMVAHLVHKNDAGQLAVVAVLFKRGHENAALKPVWGKLPEKAGPEHKYADIKVNPAKLLPAAKGYYTFEGSLTTPPCTEGVRWLVLKQPVEMSAAQLAAVSKIVHSNARPVQPLNGRVVEESL